MSLPLTVLDCLLLLVILVSTVFAVWRGFLWETLTIFAWVAAIFGCLYLSPHAVPLVARLVGDGWAAKALAYVVTFLVVFIPVTLISRRISQGIKRSPIGPLDRVAGAAFGVVRGLVIAALAYMAFDHFLATPNQQPHWMIQARLFPVVQSTARVLQGLLPNLHGSSLLHPDTAPLEIRQETAHAPSHGSVTGMVRPSTPATHPDGVAALIRGAQVPAPEKFPKASPQASTKASDSLAALIANDGNSVPKTTREPAQKIIPRHVVKSTGTSDRQRLNDLIENGGNANR